MRIIELEILQDQWQEQMPLGNRKGVRYVQGRGVGGVADLMRGDSAAARIDQRDIAAVYAGGSARTASGESDRQARSGRGCDRERRRTDFSIWKWIEGDRL
jgi:hypothetical protein